MVDSKENYKFDLGVKGLTQNLPFGLYFEMEGSDSTLTSTWEVGGGGEGRVK